mgnify:CR=1 FL=1
MAIEMPGVTNYSKDPIDALRYACKPLILPQIGGDFETHQIHIRRS